MNTTKKVRCIGVAATAALALSAGSAHADGARFDAGAGIALLIAGGKNPRGGGTLVAQARLALPLGDYVDASFATVPHVVTPYSWEKIGFIGALDLGIGMHPRDRSFTIGASATAVPFLFLWQCNLQRCLREPDIAWGGEAHVDVPFTAAPDGRGWYARASVRLLYVDSATWEASGDPKAIGVIQAAAGGTF